MKILKIEWQHLDVEGTVTYEGNEYEDIPAKAIRHAAFKVLGLDTIKVAPAVNFNCGCDGAGCC